MRIRLALAGLFMLAAAGNALAETAAYSGGNWTVRTYASDSGAAGCDVVSFDRSTGHFLRIMYEGGDNVLVAIGNREWRSGAGHPTSLTFGAMEETFGRGYAYLDSVVMPIPRSIFVTRNELEFAAASDKGIPLRAEFASGAKWSMTLDRSTRPALHALNACFLRAAEGSRGEGPQP